MYTNYQTHITIDRMVLFNPVGDLVVELRRQRNREKKEGKVLFNPFGDLVVELRRQRNREKKEGKVSLYFRSFGVILVKWEGLEGVR
ncbi:hypothetical protein NDU88_005732 [Pleurodeles waltl]|uniref:Uncharacterized protein n=1 Tax=Pleurodeles waltl TaxID=8319 RepID=A0AAV7VKQ9_PLEWA|nr:hypothetical protein NDU88_005732 [Pleurodeles waltl]